VNETPEDFPQVPEEPIDVPDFPQVPPGEEPDVIEFPDDAELDPQDLDNKLVEGE